MEQTKEEPVEATQAEGGESVGAEKQEARAGTGEISAHSDFATASLRNKKSVHG